MCGAPWGNFAWGGQHRAPMRLRVGSVISIVMYAIFAVVALDRTEVIRVFPWAGFSVVAMWVIVAYLVLGTVLNGFSRSTPEAGGCSHAPAPKTGEIRDTPLARTADAACRQNHRF